MEYNTLIAYVFGIILLYVAIWIFYRPLKSLFKVLTNTVVGCIAMYIFNLVGGLMGITVGINLYTSMTVGILGVPGFGLLLILQRIL